MRDPDWSVVVPVKRLTEAKSRLRIGRLRLAPERLALAMARDTVAAAVATPRVAEVLVVTDDPEVVAGLAGLAVTVVPEPSVGGLNQAVSWGAAGASNGWIAALPADLPTLRPDELGRALATVAAAARPGFVPDLPGTGTTLLAAVPGHRLDPQFGPGSADRHGAAGAYRLRGDWPSLRRDVDTEQDLAAAVELGLGAATAAVWRELALADPAAARHDDCARGGSTDMGG